MRHLFLSPHFDDAVGSCGGSISRLATLGHQTQVLTLFGGKEQRPLSGLAKALHQEWGLEQPVLHRRAEDAGACRILRCEQAFLKVPEALYRTGADGTHLYASVAELFGAVAEQDNDAADRILEALRQVALQTWDAVYCPTAMGHHVDHEIAWRCGQRLEQMGTPVIYYQNFYYDEEPPSRRLNPVIVELSSQEIEKKIAAFSSYASQIEVLFGTEQAMQTYFRTRGRHETFLIASERFREPLGDLFSQAG